MLPGGRVYMVCESSSSSHPADQAALHGSALLSTGLTAPSKRAYYDNHGLRPHGPLLTQV